MPKRELRHARHARHVGTGVALVPLLVTLLLSTETTRSTITDADNLILIICNYVGDASFALTGSLAAGRESMDAFGCTIVGFVTALGGGSFRDLVLGRTPLWWLWYWDEALLVVTVSLATFFVWPSASRRFRLTPSDEWLFWTDTLGLGVFAANGAYSGSQNSNPRLHLMACAACGCMTATFGGVIRDILSGRPPRILYSRREMYGLPALSGGLATTLSLRVWPTMVMEAILFGFWVTVLLRVLAINHELRLPVFPAKDLIPEEARPRDLAATMALKFARKLKLRVEKSSTLINKTGSVGDEALAESLLEDGQANLPVSSF